MEENKTTDKIVDFLFEKNNLKYLILLFIIGFVLRGVIANNISPNADEMLHAPHAINFINSGKLQIMDQDPIWFFLTDLSYKIFGVSLFAARFLAVFFGALSIIILYLIIKLMYNKNIALISSVLLTFSSFHILMSLAEMDVAMMFFVLLSSYFFIKTLKENNDRYLPFSYVFLGIAILVKQIAITFIPVFIISYVYYKIKEKSKINYKQILIFILIMFIMSFPVLTFNYLLHKDKGLVDLQFSRFLGVAKDTYKPIEATIQPFSLNKLFGVGEQSSGIIDGLSFFLSFDKLIFILSILGLIIAFLIKKKFLLFWILSFIIPFIFLSGTSLLEYHFIFGMPILALFCATFIDFLSNKLEKIKLKKSILIPIFLLIIIIFNVSFVYSRGAFSKGEISKMMSYSRENIEDDSLVIVDSRVYRGRIVWTFNNKHYLESSYLNELLNTQDQIPGGVSSIKTYFIECVTDDCGWGTISNQQDFNQSTEEIVSFFKNNSEFLKTITTRDNEKYFNVYKTQLVLKESSLSLADSTHDWFYYPLRYTNKEKIFDSYETEKIFDSYETKNIFDKFLDWIAHLILYLEVLISLISIVIVSYLILMEDRKE